MRPSALLPAALALLALPGAAPAAPTVECHCFRNRTFDPAEPAAADPYILAATRSSLLSAAFGVAKGDLVRAVMTGTTPEALWIAHWSAARTARAAASLLDARAATGSWRAALAGAAGLPTPFASALARGAPDADLAAHAVDDVLASRLGAEPGTLRTLRDAGATSEQVIVATFLAPRLRAAAPAVLARHREGKATWGTLLREGGLAPGQIEGAVRAALR